MKTKMTMKTNLNLEESQEIWEPKKGKKNRSKKKLSKDSFWKNSKGHNMEHHMDSNNTELLNNL